MRFQGREKDMKEIQSIKNDNNPIKISIYEELEGDTASILPFAFDSIGEIQRKRGPIVSKALRFIFLSKQKILYL